MTLRTGDTVTITPNATKLPDGTIQPVYAVVVNPHRPTDMVRVDGTPVVFYVDVVPLAHRDTPALGYHAESLQKV